jgi:hypothetical protein
METGRKWQEYAGGKPGKRGERKEIERKNEGEERGEERGEETWGEEV